MVYTNDLQLGYKILWDSMVFKKNNVIDKQREAQEVVNKMLENKPRYENVLVMLKKKYPKAIIPWWFIAVVHKMECNLSFRHHLHNGDPLSKRTVHVPAGRPVNGNPPFTFVDSCIDALYLKGLTNERDWSIPHVLYILEGYNGYGYTLYRKMNSPYLWSGSQHYVKGKYVADGKFDPEAVSTQLGVALYMKLLLK